MSDIRHWAWTGVNRDATDEQLKAKYTRLAQGGLHGIFIDGGIDDREFEIIREAGLELHAWMWTTNRGDQFIRDHHPDWFQVSRSGKSCFDQPPYVEYYRWITPVRRDVQDYLTDRASELAAHQLVQGVHLDYVRYPDVILPTGLWAKYGLDQTEELPDYDFSYDDATCEAFKEKYGRDPRDIEDPATDQEWLHFRYDTVTNLVRRLAGAVHSHEKPITAAVFPTPSMARKICRQDWDKWPLDAVCPMIYHSFYNEPLDWIGDCVREDVQAVRFPVYAGLFMPAFTTVKEFEDGVLLALRRGAKGVSLFAADNIKDEHLEILSTLTP